MNCQENEYPLVSVIIPCFNEEENIPVLAEQVRTVFATLSRYRYECLIVDDGSTDATSKTLREVAAQDPNIHPLHLVKLGSIGRTSCGIAARPWGPHSYIGRRPAKRPLRLS